MSDRLDRASVTGVRIPARHFARNTGGSTAMVLARYNGNAWLLEGCGVRSQGRRLWAAISDSHRRIRAFGHGETIEEAVDDAVRDYFDSAETSRSSSDDNAVRFLHHNFLKSR